MKALIYHGWNKSKIRFLSWANRRTEWTGSSVVVGSVSFKCQYHWQTGWAVLAVLSCLKEAMLETFHRANISDTIIGHARTWKVIKNRDLQIHASRATQMVSWSNICCRCILLKSIYISMYFVWHVSLRASVKQSLGGAAKERREITRKNVRVMRVVGLAGFTWGVLAKLGWGRTIASKQRTWGAHRRS